LENPKDPYHHGNLARALVDVGLAMIEADGATALSLRELAKRTKVSAAAVYRHFADKESLLAAIAAEGFAALNEAFAKAMAELPPGDPLPRLRALGQAYIAFALAHPGLYRLMFGANRPASPGPPPLEQESHRAYDTLNETVAACCGASADSAAVTAATVAAWSLVHGFSMLHLEGLLSGFPAEALPDASAVLANLIPKG
jgi:AcrR family transcriptional regulator